MVNRVVASVIASGAASIITFPLDTYFISRQFKKPIKSYYSGIKIDLLNTCLTTATFFQTYEMCKHHGFPVYASTSLSTITGSLVNTPMSIMKREEQKNKNLFFTKKHSIVQKVLNTYQVMVVKEMPKNMIKYILYEKCLFATWSFFRPFLCGGACAFLASTITIIFCYPLEALNIRIACGIDKDVKDFFTNSINIYDGFFIYFIQYLLSNMIGHSMLECIRPRY